MKQSDLTEIIQQASTVALPWAHQLMNDNEMIEWHIFGQSSSAIINFQ